VAEAIADGVRLAGLHGVGFPASGDQAIDMRRQPAVLALVDVDLGDGPSKSRRRARLAGIGPITVIVVTFYPYKIRRATPTPVSPGWRSPTRVLAS